MLPGAPQHCAIRLEQTRSDPLQAMHLRTAILVFALSLAGCGGSTSATLSTATGRNPSLASVCGTLRARLAGVANEDGARDPQPANLRGDKPIIPLTHASQQSVVAISEVENELRSLHAPAAVVTALGNASAQYERFEKELRTTKPSGAVDGIRLVGRYLRINTNTVLACSQLAERTEG
jgi:hypothetical protein